MLLSLILLLFGIVPLHEAIAPNIATGSVDNNEAFRNVQANRIHNIIDAGIFLQPARYSFEFNNVSLDRAFFMIAESTGNEFIYESYLTEGEMVNSRYNDESLQDILDHLLASSGLEARRIRTGMYIVYYALHRSISPLLFPSVLERTNAELSSSRWKLTGFDHRHKPVPQFIRSRTIFLE